MRSTKLLWRRREKQREAEKAEAEQVKKDQERVEMNKTVAIKLSDLDRKIRLIIIKSSYLYCDKELY